MGVGEATADTKQVTGRRRRSSQQDRRPEAGDHPRRARPSRQFKVRENMPIGAKVTLRKARMYEFLDRLITIALPRVRDFRGLTPNRLRRPRQLRHGRQGAHQSSRRSTTTRSIAIWGMDVIICTTAKTDAEARRCSTPSTSRSQQSRRARTRKQTEAPYGEEELDREEQPRAASWSKQFAGKRAQLKADRPVDSTVRSRSGSLRS
jgi:large subunit ribosomal protein L5